MKTLIVYATKYGSVKECAEMVMKYLKGEISIINLNDSLDIDFTKYDNVIIGGSIYYNKIQKLVLKFCDTNIEKLLKKKIGLFVCCGQSNDREDFVQGFFNDSLGSYAISKANLGGCYYYDKMSILDKIVVFLVSKSRENKYFLNEGKVKDFVKPFIKK